MDTSPLLLTVRLQVLHTSLVLPLCWVQQYLGLEYKHITHLLTRLPSGCIKTDKLLL